MQTLKTYSKRDFITSKKIFFSFLLSDTRRYLACHRKCITLVCSKDIDYTLFKHPLSYRGFKQINKGFHNLKSPVRFPIQNSWYSKYSGQICNFSTTFGRRQNKDDDRSSNGNSDKKPNDDEDTQLFLRKLFFTGIFAYFTIASLRYLFYSQNIKEIAQPVSWNEFVHHMLAKGEVETIIVYPELGNAIVKLYDGAVVKGQRVDNPIYYITLANVESFEGKLRNVERRLGIGAGEAVTVIYDRKVEIFRNVFKVTVIMLVSGALFYFFKKKKGFPLDFFSHMKAAKFTLVDPVTGAGKGVRFEDVAGLKEAKIEVMEFVDYLKRPEHYKTLGAKVPRGALLLGPPGCGKTLLAKAVATEASVPFLSMNGSEFIEMYGGVGAARVRSLFKEGKKRAPSIIYIDEIDALGKKRASGNSSMGSDSSESEQTLNQLLVEMDGMRSREGVIILASTNRAEVLDKALLRPGRFDRHILIDLPTLEERKQIFEQHLKRIALEQKPSAYSERLAYLTPGFSGADIANVCNEAALHAARFKKKIVDASDLAYGVDRMVGGTEKRDHAMSLPEKRVVAYHESGHALVGWLLEHTDALLKVTIVPRTNLALGFAQYTPTDQKLYTKEELFERMCMMLGGRVAESLTFNKITTGAQNDLTKVTKLAYAQVQQYGMCPTVGLLSFDEEQTSTQTKKVYSKKLANLMDAEARRLIAQAYQRTEKLLSENRKKLELIAETLFKKETLMYDDVVALIGPPAYKKKRLIEPADFERSITSIEESASSTTTTSM